MLRHIIFQASTKRTFSRVQLNVTKWSTLTSRSLSHSIPRWNNHDFDQHQGPTIVREPGEGEKPIPEHVFRKMYSGDWICSKDHVNFRKRNICHICKEPDSNGTRVVKRGDWMCVKCDEFNFAHRTNCNSCGSSREDDVDSAVQEGDWICPECNSAYNFARRSTCFKCGASKAAEH